MVQQRNSFHVAFAIKFAEIKFPLKRYVLHLLAALSFVAFCIFVACSLTMANKGMVSFLIINWERFRDDDDAIAGAFEAFQVGMVFLTAGATGNLVNSASLSF